MKGEAYRAAKAGGKHWRWYRDQLALGVIQLRKGIRSIRAQIEQHERWIGDPSSKVENWRGRDPRYQDGLMRKWRKDIERQREQMDILEGILEEKEDG
jgi:hypothetical protein